MMKIFKTLKNLSRKTKVLGAVLATAFVIGVPAAVKAGYGPNTGRVIYDWNDPATHDGAFDGPHFNSYINTDVYGDERAFLDTKACVVNGPECYQQGTAGGYLDKNTAEIGKEYIVRAYVHNDANEAINGPNNTGIGVARNTRIRFEIPQGIGGGFTMQARISADNAIPEMVYDTADITGSEAFALEYVPGSAYISNAVHNADTGAKQLNDSIVTSQGALLGYENMDGVYPGCFPHAAFVTIRVKVVPPTIDVQKTVSKVELPGKNDISEQITAKRGDTISWRIDYKNTNKVTINNVTVRDPLPAGLTLVPGSITLSDATHQTPMVLPDTALGSGGTNVNTYLPNGNGAIRFRTKINSDFKSCEIKNIGYVRAEGVPERSDDAKVIIEDCNPSVPTYKCDMLAKPVKIGDRTYRFTATQTAAGGATFKQYIFNFNDGSATMLTNKNVVEHTFPANGKFVTTVTAQFTLNGNTVENTNDACKQLVDTTVTTTPPTSLPNTGAGSTIALFLGTTFVGAFLYRMRALRGEA